jgi:hypothetical protein
MLDEALGERFPASDPFTITPRRREPCESDAILCKDRCT